ncbi:MAG: hypothetical protein JO116_05680 [Planctomycetaceae bacterium]|nr:hypothetical protein [Planctomycetaceae bacterium]MBV8555033.1 hypothetical protein [Planctomycetaceae bacterium]
MAKLYQGQPMQRMATPPTTTERFTIDRRYRSGGTVGAITRRPSSAKKPVIG